MGSRMRELESDQFPAFPMRVNTVARKTTPDAGNRHFRRSSFDTPPATGVLDTADVRFDHQGRTVLTYWQSTPRLYAAIFEDEYCGCGDCAGLMGFGRTRSEAIAELVERDEERCVR